MSKQDKVLVNLLDQLEMGKEEQSKSKSNLAIKEVSQSNNELNRSIDQRSFDDVDAEEVEEEFHNLIVESQQDQQAKEFFNQVNKMMESGFLVDDDEVFLESFDGKDFIDGNINETLNSFVDKKMIFKPLQNVYDELKLKVDNDPENKTQYQKKMSIIDQMLNLLEKKDYNNDDKIQILKLFEKLNEEGGLPEHIHQQCMKKYPELKDFLKKNNVPDCCIF